ncbi:hypothetical protein MCOR13_002976 [Pyricularia oryzae]|nr:hypothetical protein MCOR13_002976 [Pyricularia oryzae]
MRFKNKQKIQQTTIMATMEDKRDDGSRSKACSYHNYLRLVDPRIQQSVEASAPPIQRAERPVAPIFPTMTVTAEPSRVQAAWKQANALHSAEGSPKPPRRVSTYSAAQVEPVVRRPRRVSTEPTHARHEKNKAKAKSDSDHSDVELFRKRKITRRGTGGIAKQGSDAQATVEDTHLKVPLIMDDVYESEAEMDHLDDYYGSKSHGKSGEEQSAPARRGQLPTSRARPGGSSSDEDRGGHHAGQREVYDSDLESVVSDVGKAAHAKKMRRYRSLAKGKWEMMLLDFIVNTDSIPAKYGNIHVDPKITAQLERATKLSLCRPKAFSTGILAANKTTGAILFGPPGTGKSLLAKATARESSFNMICASTAEIFQKCHGDDEKVIQALFSLARKLHPCIIFIDEADAMLGNRKAGEKRHIRAMLNQFLMEWDGLMSGLDSPFVLLATNRPTDLDPAVLRRAPGRIHLDLPSLAQRSGILQLLLTGERLAPDVTIEKLAKMTTHYSGSDLKNMCVAAARQCIWEQEEDTTDRTLTLNHFHTALVTVKATGLSRVVENEFNIFKNGAGSGAVRATGDDE